MKITATLIATVLIASCSMNKTGTKEEGRTPGATEVIAKEPSRNERVAIIRAYEDTMHAARKLDPRIGKAAVAAYTDFCRVYFNDTLCADYTFKAAEIEDNMDNPNKAIELYKDVYNSYTQFPYRAEALFRIANIYELKLNDYANAQIYYNDVITYFPRSPLAEGAQAAMKNMGKTDTELIREFEKKNGVKK
ncbi:MAG: tetratricopeptide repeat protein [Bacteroidia bacterium]